MKIAYCIPSLYLSGGMERVLTTKANYFADELGYDVTIIMTDGGIKPPYYDLSSKVHLIQLNIDFDVLLTLPFYKKVLVYLKKQQLYKRKLTACLLKLRPDIAISMLRREINFINDIPDGSKKIGEIHFSRVGYREVNIKFLPNFINHSISKVWFNKLLKEIKRLSAFVVLTDEDKRNWPLLPNIHVIRNPLSFTPKSVSNCGSKKIIAVGRYDPIKGYDNLLKAWSIVALEYPEWVLNIYGGGNPISLQTEAFKMNVGTNFICNGQAYNIEQKYTESSFLVLSSRQEGFGLVLVEAMACGLPCVSFDCPCGPRDIIRNGENGFLVENGNVKQLAEKIIQMIEHPDERRLIGKRAKESIVQFKMDVIGKQWEELFNKVMGG